MISNSSNSSNSLINKDKEKPTKKRYLITSALPYIKIDVYANNRNISIGTMSLP